jgi:hypothetical protein
MRDAEASRHDQGLKIEKRSAIFPGSFRRHSEAIREPVRTSGRLSFRCFHSVTLEPSLGAPGSARVGECGLRQCVRQSSLPELRRCRPSGKPDAGSSRFRPQLPLFPIPGHRVAARAAPSRFHHLASSSTPSSAHCAFKTTKNSKVHSSKRLKNRIERQDFNHWKIRSLMTHEFTKRLIRFVAINYSNHGSQRTAIHRHFNRVEMT